MKLQQSEWLHIAQSIPVGQTRRVRHLHEGRTNLVIKNEPDRWMAWCQACKEGGVVKKEHVKLTGTKAPADSESLALPWDMVRVQDCDEHTQRGVLGFIASKNMDQMYLPDLWFSKSRKRVMVQHGDEWLGRDTTGASMQKWLTYNKSTFLDNGRRYPHALVVEDPFSFYKVSFAVRDLPIAVYSSLGTSVSDKLFVRLLRHDSALYFYDGDAAGYKGADKESHRLRAAGLESWTACAPPNMDPKDMQILDIQRHASTFLHSHT